MHAVPLFLAALAGAQPALTFDQALGLADHAPGVEGARSGAAAARELAGQVSSQTSNPELRIEPGYRLSESPSSVTRFEGTAALSQTWNLAGLSSRRRDAASSEADVAAVEARAAALARRLSAAQAWIDLWAAQQAYTGALEELRLADDLAARSDRAAGQALLTRADAADAAAYRAEARLLALSVEGEVTDLGYRLAREASVPAAALAASGPLPDVPVPPSGDWPQAVERAAALPEARARRLAAHADAARAAEARAARGTALTLGAALQRDNLAEYVGFAQVGVTLPLFDRGEREAALSEAAAARARGEADDLARAAGAELARAFHEVEHTGEVLHELEAGFLPASLEAARLREVAFRAGDATVLEVLVARRSAAAARARLSRAQAAHAWARVKVWLQLAEMERGDAS
ncbi:MAG TPA: TolC family protein [Anaeromyxobacteraceae bacterium]|nr:TolC family protein [Anaeromyxobacteraceae bacterium]